MGTFSPFLFPREYLRALWAEEKAKEEEEPIWLHTENDALRFYPSISTASHQGHYTTNSDSYNNTYLIVGVIP